MRGSIGTIVVDEDDLPSDTGKGCIEGRNHRLDVCGLAVCRHDDAQARRRDECTAIGSRKWLVYVRGCENHLPRQQGCHDRITSPRLPRPSIDLMSSVWIENLILLETGRIAPKDSAKSVERCASALTRIRPTAPA